MKQQGNDGSALGVPSRLAYPSFVLLLSTALLPAIVSPVHAQIIQGRILDQTTRRPVGSASVLLLNKTGVVRTMTLSDTAGFYAVSAPGSGTYSLRVDAAGYNTLNALPFDIDLGQTLQMDLLIWDLTKLAPVVVTAEAKPFAPGPLEGFYQRKERAMGQFLTREDIEQKGGTRFTDILRLVPGVDVVPLRGSPHYTARLKSAPRGCPPELWVDNVRWGSIDIGGGPDREFFPSDLEGIEIYTPATVPAEFAVGNSLCGVIVVWTKRAP